MTARQQFVMERVVAAGYPPISAAAIVGNGCGESGANLDSTFLRVHADHESGGFLEWRDSQGAPRKTRMVQFADLHGLDRSDLGMQVDYAIWELGKYFAWLDAQLRNPEGRTLKNLVANFCDVFENPAKATEGLDNRIDHAVKALAAWEAAHQVQTPQPATPAPIPPAPDPGAPPAPPLIPAPRAPPAGPPISASDAGFDAAVLDNIGAMVDALVKQRAAIEIRIAALKTAAESFGKPPEAVNPLPPPLQIPAANQADQQPQRKIQMPKNWQTSLFGSTGIIAAIFGVYHSVSTGTPIDATQIALIIGLVSQGIGLINAKDKNVTGGTVPQTAEATTRAKSPPIH